MAKALTAKQFVAALADPDHIGQSEYRILHELLTETVEGDPGASLELLETELDKVQEWVEVLRNSIQHAKAGRKYRIVK